MTQILKHKDAENAPWLVLLPGATHGAWLWIHSLRQTALPFHLLCYDNPGIDGKSINNINNVQDIAQDVLAEMNRHHVKKAVILGHSLGGFVAQELALHAPDRVDKLILVSTCMGQPWLAQDFARLAMKTADYKQLIAEGDATETGARQVLLGAKAQTENPAQIDDFIQTRAATWPPKEVRRLHTSIAGRYSSAGRVHKVQQPALVLHGAADILVSPASAYALAQQLRHAHWLALPDVGHMPMVEDPAFWQYVQDAIHDKPIGQPVTPLPPLKMPLQNEITAAGARIHDLWQKMKQNMGPDR